MSKITLELNGVFAKYMEGESKKTGRPYKMLELSNGIRSKLFTVGKELATEDFANFREGEEVTVTLEVLPFDDFSTFVVREIK